MTFLFQLLWYLTAYLLLRCMYDAHRAIQGIGVLLVVPCVYGGLRVFNLAEPFFTARLPAEFLAFAGLWAWLSERRVLATVLFAIGALVHPLMMFPAILLVLLSMAASRWEWRGPALITLAGFVLAVGEQPRPVRAQQPGRIQDLTGGEAVDDGRPEVALRLEPHRGPGVEPGEQLRHRLLRFEPQQVA